MSLDEWEMFYTDGNEGSVHSFSGTVRGGPNDGMRLAVAVCGGAYRTDPSRVQTVVGLSLGPHGASPPFITLTMEQWRELVGFVESASKKEDAGT